ncbi:MAG: M56 family metallopeptidase [Clostridia bacterium]|nr:M56 family metallopeptidase [Clostridia bacterium]
MRTAGIYNFLVESTIIASIAILLMIPVRKFFRKSLGSRVICFAWLLVAIRLLCPIALPNPIIHEIQTPFNFDQENIRPMAGQLRVRFDDAISAIRSRYIRSEYRQGRNVDQIRKDPVMQATEYLSTELLFGRLPHAVIAVYLIGAGGVAGWFIFSNIRFRRQLKKARIEPLPEDMRKQYELLCLRHGLRSLPVYLTDPLPGACLVGVIRPYIALPLMVRPSDALYMLLHETWHFKAKDPVWTLVQLICCVVHWFNPLVWLAARWCRADREMRCDENVTRSMDDEGKQAYAAVLVQSAAKRAAPGLPVLATGMSMTGRKLKVRVAAIVQNGRRVLAAAVAFAVFSSLLLVCAFATVDPYARSNDWMYDNPDWYDQALELPWRMPQQTGPFRTVTDTDAALALAKKAFSEYMGLDVSQTQWKANHITWSDEEAYTIQADQDPMRLEAFIQQDGNVNYIFASKPDQMETGEKDEDEYIFADQITDLVPELDQLVAYALEIAEFMEPGITRQIDGVRLLGEWRGPSHRVLNLELAVPGQDGRTVTLEYVPEVRLMYYGRGNG